MVPGCDGPVPAGAASSVVSRIDSAVGGSGKFAENLTMV
jgi:hypothetical protein